MLRLGVRSQSECTACSTWEADFKAFAASYSNDTSSSQSSQDSSCGGDVSCDSAYTFDRPECYAECLVRVAKDQGRMCDECDRFNKEEDAAIRESIEAIRYPFALTHNSLTPDYCYPHSGRLCLALNLLLMSTPITFQGEVRIYGFRCTTGDTSAGREPSSVLVHLLHAAVRRGRTALRGVPGCQCDE